MNQIKEWLKYINDEYKGIAITILIISFVFIIARVTVFSGGSSSEKIRYLILGKVIEELCVAPEENIFMTDNGPVAVIDGQKINVKHLWSYKKDDGKKDRYIAVVIYKGAPQEVLQIKQTTAYGYSAGKMEACLSFKGHSTVMMKPRGLTN